MQYIARGQIKTLAVYDAFPSLSNSQIEKQADWYAKTQKFQRAVAKGDGKLEDKVNAFFSELAKPFEHVRSAAAIDAEVAKEWQFTDVPERLGVKRRRPRSPTNPLTGSALGTLSGRSSPSRKQQVFCFEDYDNARSNTCTTSYRR